MLVVVCLLGALVLALVGLETWVMLDVSVLMLALLAGAGWLVWRKRGPSVPTLRRKRNPNFRGREDELALLQDWHSKARGQQGGGPVKILIHGPAGIGKSELGHELAHKLASEYPHGQLSVDLGDEGGRRPPGEILGQLLRELGRTDLPDDFSERQNMFRSLTWGRKLLLVFDAARDGDQVMNILPTWSGCTVIVTSRPNLGGMLDARSMLLNLPTETDAYRMLTAYLPAGEHAAPDVIARVVTLCERLPLALRAAAHLARSENNGLAGVLRALEPAASRLEYLSPPDFNVRERIDTAYRTAVSMTERDALLLLSELKTSTFVPWMLQVLMDESAQEAAALLDGLSGTGLVDNLSALPEQLYPPDPSKFDRYRLSPLVRRYLRGRRDELDPVRRQEALIRLHTAALVCVEEVLCAKGEMSQPQHPLVVPEEHLPDVADWVDRIADRPEDWVRKELGTLVEVVTLAFELQRHQVCWLLASWIGGCVTDDVDIRPMKQSFRTAVQAAQHLRDPKALIRVNRAYGMFLATIEEYPEAIGRLYAAVNLATEKDLLTMRAWVHHAAGRVWQRLGCYRAAREDLLLAQQNGGPRAGNGVAVLLAENDALTQPASWQTDIRNNGTGRDYFDERLVVAEAATRRGKWNEAREQLKAAEPLGGEDPVRRACLHTKWAMLELREQEGRRIRSRGLRVRRRRSPPGEVRRALEAAVMHSALAVATAERFGGIGELRARVLLAEALLARAALPGCEQDGETCVRQLERAEDLIVKCEERKQARYVGALQAELLRVRGLLALHQALDGTPPAEPVGATEEVHRWDGFWCAARTRLILGEIACRRDETGKGMAHLHTALEAFETCGDEAGAQRARRLIARYRPRDPRRLPPVWFGRLN
ncbi:NB-ARC domain-containing protein [Spirillospora sp. CA-253888]